MDARAVARVKQLYFSIEGRQGAYEYKIDHPAFAKWKARRNYIDRLNVILGEVGSVEGKEVLDIGCCEGAFSHHLAKRGAAVTGVDWSAWRIELAGAISAVYGLSPQNPVFLAMRFEAYLEERTRHFGKNFLRYDFILYLALFHHFLRKGLKVAWEKVALISQCTDRAFIEIDYTPIHCARVIRMGHKPKELPVAIPRLIIENSGFKAFKELPTRRAMRHFYLFTT